MRLFFALDGDDKFNEIELGKLKCLPGDTIVCHDQDSFALMSGHVLMSNINAKVLQAVDGKVTAQKEPVHLFLYTKVPSQVLTKRGNSSVTVSVTF